MTSLRAQKLSGLIVLPTGSPRDVNAFDVELTTGVEITVAASLRVQILIAVGTRGFCFAGGNLTTPTDFNEFDLVVLAPGVSGVIMADAPNTHVYWITAIVGYCYPKPHPVTVVSGCGPNYKPKDYPGFQKYTILSHGAETANVGVEYSSFGINTVMSDVVIGPALLLPYPGRIGIKPAPPERGISSSGYYVPEDRTVKVIAPDPAGCLIISL